MRKKRSLCAEFCSSGAAEQASRNFWIMSEFSPDLQIICHKSGVSLGWPTFKGKQGWCVCGSVTLRFYALTGNPAEQLRVELSSILLQNSCKEVIREFRYCAKYGTINWAHQLGIPCSK